MLFLKGAMMKNFFKKYFPIIVRILRPFRVIVLKVFEEARLQFFLFFKDNRHRLAIKEINYKLSIQKKINIAFIVFDPAVWKYERIYRLFELDSRFLPTIIIAVRNGHNQLESFEKAKHFFINSHNVLGGIDSNIKLHKNFNKLLNPDIVFTSVPYNYFDRKFKIYRLSNKLTIFTQYSINLTNIKFVNINNHNNLLWRCYVESNYHYYLYDLWAKELGKSKYNLRVSGYVGANYIKHKVDAKESLRVNKAKLVIWAPHWTVDKSNTHINISSFLDYYQIMLEIVREYKNKIDFVLKPHPFLREKLSEGNFLGIKETEKYYKKWINGNNTRLEEGNYVELFNKSDAIIHDSGGFIVEYLYTGKPAAYLVNDSFDLDFYNDYGKEALKTHQFIKNKNDIVSFLDDLLSGVDPKLEQRQKFYNQYLRDHHHTASENVYNDILNSILDVK